MPKVLSKKLTPPLKWHGGKSYLADWIISLMPPRCKDPNSPAMDDSGWLHYVEPYFGGGSVLLANNPNGISEVANDLNLELTIFWRVLSCEEQFKEFQRRVEAIPFSEEEWKQEAVGESRHGTDVLTVTAVETAVRFFVRCRQSLAGRMDAFAPLSRARTRRGMNEQVSAWLNAVEGLPAVHSRLKRVIVLNRPALDVIKSQDGERTLFYLDPPYLHETRASTGEYEYEMTENDHAELLNKLVSVKFSGGSLEGRFLLSGYRSDLYDDYAKRFGWKRHEMKISNNAASGKTKRVMTECVWTNF